MGTRTIGITNIVYERLAAEMRKDESYSDTIARLLDTVTSDWRHGFGRYGDEEVAVLEHLVSNVQETHAIELATREREVFGALGFELDERENSRERPETASE